MRDGCLLAVASAPSRAAFHHLQQRLNSFTSLIKQHHCDCNPIKRLRHASETDSCVYLRIQPRAMLEHLQTRVFRTLDLWNFPRTSERIFAKRTMRSKCSCHRTVYYSPNPLRIHHSTTRLIETSLQKADRKNQKWRQSTCIYARQWKKRNVVKPSLSADAPADSGVAKRFRQKLFPEKKIEWRELLYMISHFFINTYSLITNQEYNNITNVCS